MPTYVVTKGHDALIYYDTIVEAETRQDAKRIAESVDYDGEWIGTGDMASYDDFEIDEHDGVRLLEDGETIEKLLTISVSAPERDALLTGLRRLQLALRRMISRRCSATSSPTALPIPASIARRSICCAGASIGDPPRRGWRGR